MTLLDIAMPDQVIKDSINNTLENQIGKETLIFVIVIVLAIIIMSILAFLKINKKGNIQIDTEIIESKPINSMDEKITEIKTSKDENNQNNEKKEE